MQHCAAPRAKQDGTWISSKIIDAYCQLHALGFAHSIEVYDGDELIGGLYGIGLGKIFFGESMFSLKSNASKTGFVFFCQQFMKDLDLCTVLYFLLIFYCNQAEL